MAPHPLDAVLRLPGPSSAEAAGVPIETESAVAGLFGVSREPLLRYVRALGLPAADAEEVVQDVFMALLQHLRRGRPNVNLRGWLFRVARNLTLKRRTIARRTLLAPDRAHGQDGAAAWDRTPNPEEQLEGGRRHARLLAVLKVLPERDRSCLFLRAEGLRYREIAQVLGISLGSVASSLKRSFSRLERAEEG